MRRLRVAVLSGGPSPEAEVSRVSGRCVAEALDATGHQVAQIELSPGIVTDLEAFGPDTVVPMLHGAPGEDGSVQAMLDLLGYSYVGSDQAASNAAMHKTTTKDIAARSGLPVAPDILLQRGDDLEAAGRRILEDLGHSLAIKPDDQGSALGVELLREVSLQALRIHLEEALTLNKRVLVEPFKEGAELTVGVLDLYGEVARAFPVIEIRTPEHTWYDYHHRYTPGESEHLVPAPIPDDVSASLQQATLDLHRLLGCRDFSRTDFIRSDDGEVTLLELNNLPGMTPTSLFPDGARAIGMEFEELVDRLVASAFARGPSAMWRDCPATR